VVKALAAIPDETVIDGEIVALDERGRPSFNALQNYGSSTAPVFYYVFECTCAGRQKSYARAASTLVAAASRRRS